MFVIYLIGRQLGGSAPVLFGGPLPWGSYAIGLQNVWMTIHQDYGAAWMLPRLLIANAVRRRNRRRDLLREIALLASGAGDIAARTRNWCRF